MDDPAQMGSPTVMGSRCFTKYKWRTDAEASQANGPTIVATQVVSEFPFSSPGSDNLPSFKPVVMYTYKMQFTKY